MADKRKCKYYKACGNNLNCSRCTGYQKEDKKKEHPRSVNKTDAH